MTGPSTHKNSPSTGSAHEPKFSNRHPKYYIEGADFHIIVGVPGADKTLFRVHSFFFTRESTTFHRKAHPASPGGVAIGTDKDPVVLDNVTPEEFETFVWVFYNPRYSIYEKTVKEWKTILRLATEWGFTEVKELVVRELHKKGPAELPLVDRLALYEKHQVDPRHLIPLYAILCSRDTPLRRDEAHSLGLDTAVMISTMREQLRALPSNEGRSPLPENTDVADVFRALERVNGVTEGSTLAFQRELGLDFDTNELANLGHNLNGGTQANGTAGASGGKGKRVRHRDIV